MDSNLKKICLYISLKKVEGYTKNFMEVKQAKIQ